MASASIITAIVFLSVIIVLTFVDFFLFPSNQTDLRALYVFAVIFMLELITIFILALALSEPPEKQPQPSKSNVLPQSH